MANPDVNKLDMTAELFLEPFQPIPAEEPQVAEAQLLEMLRTADSRSLKLLTVLDLIGLSRWHRLGNGGKFTQEGATRLLCELETQISTPEEQATADLLMAEATFCEHVGDFQGAAWLYEGALRFKIESHKTAYFRLNNLGFCLNYLKRFEEAKEYLRQAIDLEPRAYNAWKNAGVAFECLGEPLTAANGYMHAINKSGGESRSLRHLLRLVERHPELKRHEQVAGYLDSLVKHGKIKR